jgi:hypothetical protein
MTGKIYGIPPQPPVEGNMHYFGAGAVRFGVEYRDLDPESLVDTYKDNPDYLAEMIEKSPEGGFADEGVSLHVFDARDGREYLRFDMFDDEPHYHYIQKTDDDSVVNQVIDFDRTALGNMLPWTLERLRTRLGDMLAQAGATELSKTFDASEVDAALREVEACCAEAGAH